MSGPAEASHPACEGCALRDRCSPPLEWNEAELQPFGSRDPLELWRRFSERFGRATGAAPSPTADAMVARHSETLRAMPSDVWELEPSVVVTDRVEPRLRLAMFHGPLPEESDDAREVTAQLIDAWADLHRISGSTLSPSLRSVLERHAPFEMPLGFEMLSPERAHLKAYARVRHLGADHRRALCAELAALLTGPLDAAHLVELERASPTLWDDVHMFGLGTRDGGLVALKLYIERDGRAGWPELDIPPTPADHPFEILAGHRAFAVVDLAHPVRRSHKLDYYLRERLLSGPMLAAMGRRIFHSETAAQLATLAEHHDYRVDVVAGALRGDTWAFYLVLG